MRIKRHQFTVDDGILLHLLKGLRNRLIVVADDQAVARVERDATLADGGDHEKTVPFALEDPVAVVERRVDERRQHGLQLLGELGLTRHWTPATDHDLGLFDLSGLRNCIRVRPGGKGWQAEYRADRAKRTTVNRRGAEPFERGQMLADRVALVLREPITRMLGVQLMHES